MVQQRNAQADPPEFLTVDEVAAILRIGRSTVYAYIKQLSLPAVHLGATVRIRRSALEAWIARHETLPEVNPTR